jgi:hypothetical protein
MKLDDLFEAEEKQITLYRGIQNDFDDETHEYAHILYTTPYLNDAKKYAGKGGTIAVFNDLEKNYYDILKDSNKLLQIYEYTDLENSESKLNQKIRKLGFKGFKGPQQKMPQKERIGNAIEYAHYGPLKPVKFIQN